MMSETATANAAVTVLATATAIVTVAATAELLGEAFRVAGFSGFSFGWGWWEQASPPAAFRRKCAEATGETPVATTVVSTGEKLVATTVGSRSPF